MNRGDLARKLRKSLLILDGAMGTELSQRSAASYGCPEELNLSAGELVRAVHQDYVASGCHIIQTNTFGANRIKLAEYGLDHQAEKINGIAATLARSCAGSDVLVAGSIGPTGKMLPPVGTLTWDDAYAAFAEQATALANGGVDFINIETMSDLQEAKAAVVAARDVTSLPVVCSVTFDAEGRMLCGSGPTEAAVVLTAVGAEVVGANCGMGPVQLSPLLNEMSLHTGVPLIAQANAGVPVLRAGQALYSMSTEEFALRTAELIACGAGLLGGCCGTTPQHISKLANRLGELAPPLPRDLLDSPVLVGSRSAIPVGGSNPTVVVGERINPTARGEIATALVEGDFERVAVEARAQFEAGARVIDVNVSVRLPLEQQAELMARSITAIQATLDVGVSIDTTEPLVAERGLQAARGRPLLNSVSGEMSSMDALLPLAARYGAAVVALSMDEQGVPMTAAGRVEVAARIVAQARKQGLRSSDIFVDTLTLTAAAGQDQLLETLSALSKARAQLGTGTILGVSNISHGLPAREHLNAAFTAMALAAGLDMAIMNPMQDSVAAIVKASDVITGRDDGARAYIESVAGARHVLANRPSDKMDVKALALTVLRGERKRAVTTTVKLLSAGVKPESIIAEGVANGLELAGVDYERKKLFLPELMMAAEAAEGALAEIYAQVPDMSGSSAGKVVIATVRGDVHDIGKNIVAVMLRNHGFTVVDLGKDVTSDDLVAAVATHRADILALSALMTTTAPRMHDVISGLRIAGSTVPVMVGGAVIDEEYAREIGAHYAPDARGAVVLARRLLEGGDRRERQP